MHFLWMGILLGLGAAIPIGPVNMEIARRTLRFGFPYGTITGVGACLADLAYLVLLSLGILSLLQYPSALQWITVAGSLILAWFGFNAFRSPTMVLTNDAIATPSLWHYGFGGFFITLLNPYTILFWASVSSQISGISSTSHSIFWAGLGVIIGTFGWVLFLNSLLHFTRHFIGEKVTRALNYTGGMILLIFAGMGLMRVF